MESIGAEKSESEKTKSEKNKLEKISIVSCNICYGQMPGQTDEVEQHLLIASDGSVSLRTLCFGAGFGRFSEGRNMNCTITRRQAYDILQSITLLLNSPDTEMKMDCGLWIVQVTSKTGETAEKEGPLTDVCVKGQSLTKLIGAELPFDKPWLFGEMPEEYYNKDSAVTLDDFPKG